jgi:hypothetical protein
MLAIAAVAVAVMIVPFVDFGGGQAKTPEQAIMLPIAAMRNNDLRALMATLPDCERDKARENWEAYRSQSDPIGDARFNQAMALIMAPGAVDSLMSMIEPGLEKMNVDDLADQIETSLAKAGPAKPDTEMVSALSTWVATAGFDDPRKMRQALSCVVDLAQAFGVRTADDLRSLNFDDLLACGGQALPHLKKALAVYGIDLDRTLDTVRVAGVEGSGPRRMATVSLTFLGQSRTLPTAVVEQDGRWFPEDTKAVAPRSARVAAQNHETATDRIQMMRDNAEVQAERARAHDESVLAHIREIEGPEAVVPPMPVHGAAEPESSP